MRYVRYDALRQDLKWSTRISKACPFESSSSSSRSFRRRSRKKTIIIAISDEQTLVICQSNLVIGHASNACGLLHGMEFRISIQYCCSVVFFCLFCWKWNAHRKFNHTSNECFMLSLFLFRHELVLMLRMDKEHDHRWKVVRRVRVSFYRIFHNVGNHFYIDPIRISKCHRNRCLGIPALQAKGKLLKKYICINKYYIEHKLVNTILFQLGI